MQSLLRKGHPKVLQCVGQTQKVQVAMISPLLHRVGSNLPKHFTRCLSVASSSSLPPPGSRAEEVLKAVLTNTYDENMLRADIQASATYATENMTKINPYSPRIKYSPRFATSKRNPKEHTYAQAGKYYNLGSQTDVSKIFPNGLAGHDLLEESAVTGANALLIRPIGVTLKAHLEHWRQSHGRALAKSGNKVLDIDTSADYMPPELNVPSATNEDGIDTPVLPTSAVLRGSANDNSAVTKVHPHDIAFRPLRMLVGPKGIGKSGVLNYVVHYARVNDWIVLFVPDAYSIAHLGKVLVPSRLRPGMVDQHDCAVAILREFLRAHGAQLANINQRGVYANFRYLPRALDEKVSAKREQLRLHDEAERSRLKAEAEAAGTVWDPSTYVSEYDDESQTDIDRSTFTLKDMVEWGIRHPTSASDALIAVMDELKQVTEYPVLIAVDGINHFYEQGPYAINGEDILPENLTIPNLFNPLDSTGFKKENVMKRGVWLASISHRSSKDMNPLFSSGKARVGMKYRVSVPPLTRQETFSQLSHYKSSGGFFMLEGEYNSFTTNHNYTISSYPFPSADIPAVDSFLVEYYRTLTGGNPLEMFKSAMFTPQYEK